MKEKALQRRNSFLLVLAAFIWGIAFVAQSEGGKFGPYTFNGIRFLLGAAVLCPVLLIMSKKNPDHKAPSPKSRKALITGGIACGIVLGFASTLQQLALFYGATAGKAGIFNYLLYFNCTNHWSVFGKKMRMEHLDWHWTGTDRSLSALYERLFLSAVAGSASPAVRPWIFLSYLVCGSFFPACGWHQAFLCPVSGSRYCLSDSCILH